MSGTREFGILLVEDDDVDIMNLQRAFRANDFDNPLYVAHDGEEALEMLRGIVEDNPEACPRVILLDLNMPRMNGIEFLAELRTDPRLQNMVVIVLTSSDDERDVAEAYAHHVAGYLVKPVTFASFVDAMATFGLYWKQSELP